MSANILQARLVLFVLHLKQLGHVHKFEIIDVGVNLICTYFLSKTGEISFDSVANNLALIGGSQFAKPVGEHVRLANIRQSKHICALVLDLLILLCNNFVVDCNL